MNERMTKPATLPGAGALTLCAVSVLSMVMGVHDIMKGHFLSQTTHYALFVIAMVTGILGIELLMRWAEATGKLPTGKINARSDRR